jgi:hypothetical protein
MYKRGLASLLVITSISLPPNAEDNVELELSTKIIGTPVSEFSQGLRVPKL